MPISRLFRLLYILLERERVPAPELAQTLEAVSYTHLDVYKRQLPGQTCDLAAHGLPQFGNARPFVRADAEHAQLRADVFAPNLLGQIVAPVSYTHLDVYKRQEFPVLRIEKMHVARRADRNAQLFAEPDDLAVEIAQLFFVFRHALAQHERVVADGLNFKIVVEPRDPFEFREMCISDRHTPASASARPSRQSPAAPNRRASAHPA